MGYIKRLLREYRIKQLKNRLQKEVEASAHWPTRTIYITCGQNSRYFSKEENKKLCMPIDTPLDEVRERLNEARTIYVYKRLLELKGIRACEALNEVLSKW